MRVFCPGRTGIWRCCFLWREKTLVGTTNSTHTWRWAWIEPGSHYGKRACSTRVVYQTREKVMYRTSKHVEEKWQYGSHTSIAFWGVWKCSKHCSDCLIYLPFSPDRSQLHCRFLLLTIVRLHLKKPPCHRSTCVSVGPAKSKLCAVSYSKAFICGVVGWVLVTWIIANCHRWWRCGQVAWHYQHTSPPTTVPWTRLNRWGWGGDNSTCGKRDGVIMETRVGRMLLVFSERTAQLSACPSPVCGLR